MKRALARGDGNYPFEKVLSSQVRASAKKDRRTYLETELENGSWKSIRRLLQGPAKKHPGIKILQCELVDSGERAETLAEYFEKIQWKVCFPNLVIEDTRPINKSSDVSESDFSVDEPMKIPRTLKAGKAIGHDSIPPEFWKYV